LVRNQTARHKYLRERIYKLVPKTPYATKKTEGQTQRRTIESRVIHVGRIPEGGGGGIK
jgi:hypothetical protein